MKKRVAYHTLGCKLNFSETSAISRSLDNSYYEKVDFDQNADFYVINTCSVTENANKKCRAIARQVLRRTPQAKIVFIGCYAQLKPSEISEIPGVSLVLGAKEKFNLASYLHDLENADKEDVLIFNSPVKDVDFFAPSYSIGDRTRTFLKVQDGCDYFCSFCTIPLARGRSRSTSIENVCTQAKEIAERGIKEIVLTGVNTGDFGKSEDGKRKSGESFSQLVKTLDKIDEIERLRISSIEPNLITSEIIETVAQSNLFMPHFHIPLQSASDKILKAMRRKYDSTFYLNKVEEIRGMIPDVCIGVDVITGFPDETEKDFLVTYEFLKTLKPSYLHVFTYSERLNTKAELMNGHLDKEIRRERSRKLRSLSRKLQRSYYSKFLGECRPVLFETGNEGDFMFGFTDNYIKVRIPYDKNLVNTIQYVMLDDINPEGIMQSRFFTLKEHEPV